MSLAHRTKPRREDLRPDEVLCSYCPAKCCQYFALAIDRPTDTQEFEYLRWFLLHDHATAFVEEKSWYLMVHTTCRHLQSDNRCGIYETRPQICRDYSTVDCEYEDDWVYDKYFETAAQVAEYAEAVLPPADRKNIRSRKPPLLPVIG